MSGSGDRTFSSSSRMIKLLQAGLWIRMEFTRIRIRPSRKNWIRIQPSTQFLPNKIHLYNQLYYVRVLYRHFLVRQKKAQNLNSLQYANRNHIDSNSGIAQRYHVTYIRWLVSTYSAPTKENKCFLNIKKYL